jgi:branched-chain amino acid transport system ATP-binding protein
MILETRKVSKTFGEIHALSEVDLRVDRGEVFGIAGPNGAGKSTLFNVIAGTFPPTEGEIHFNGHDITRLKAHRICHLGLARTFQIPQTFPTLTVKDNIRVGATFGRGRVHQRPEVIEETMDFLELTGYRDTLAANLDLYTTKMVMVAGCLATGCKLIMLDEPLAGLSMTEITAFLKVVRHINQDGGLTVIMIEHILDSLIEVSDRMLVLNNGRTIYLGDPEGVRTDAQVVEVYLGDGEVEV